MLCLPNSRFNPRPAAVPDTPRPAAVPNTPRQAAVKKCLNSFYPLEVEVQCQRDTHFVQYLSAAPLTDREMRNKSPARN